MKVFLIVFFAVCSSGCAVTPKESGSAVTTGVVAIVRSYDEIVPLGTKQREPNYYRVELEIVAPEELRGAMIEARSKIPLEETDLLRKVGASLNLVIENLKQNRGSSYSGEGRHLHGVYYIDISDIKKFSANSTH
jgi:hypothetical protein